MVYWIAIIAADIFIYMLLGFLQMDYDDSWEPSKGEYWSLASMNNKQLAFYFALQLWHVLNVIVLVYMARKIYLHVRKVRSTVT